MKAKEVPSGWLERGGRRLDCGPYMSGALEAKVLLDVLRATKVQLQDVCLGGLGGLVNAGRIKRLWVTDERHGIRFLSSTDILKADISNLQIISKQAARANPKLLIRSGWTLITRAGTIGRMAYARPDMDELACSEDVLRVIPDPEKIPPGYLYAYLSSKFGVPLVVGGTYGAIIQHIEPEHLADISVPRFSHKFEKQIDDLIEEAAALRVKASATLRTVARRFDALIDGLPLAKRQTPRISTVPARSLQQRLDAQFHDPLVRQVRERLQDSAHTTIGEWCNHVFLPGIFKRIHVEDVAYGAPYYTGSTLFWLEPQPKGVLSRKTTLFQQVSLEEGTVLVQAFGQEGGLTGRAVWVGRNLAGATTTHMLVRLRAKTKEDTAYLFGFLQSDAAYRQIASLTYGGSIPHFDESGISTVVLPLFGAEDRREIAEEVVTAVSARDGALDSERRARALIEDAIQKAAN
jgi:type I restriction enzyme S subunit